MAVAVPPQIAAIIRAGANHPQYKQAVAWLDNAKYNSDRETAVRREAEQKAKSGALDESQRHGWSMAESAAMAPILAERKAKADHAEAQRLKELQAKNPYRYQLEMMKPDKEEARLRKIAGADTLATGERMGAASGYSQPFRDAAEKDLNQRKKAREQLQGMADAVDAANDPYVKLKNEEARAYQASLKEQQTALKEQARERDAAMADVARRYLENPSIFESTYGADAANAAKSLSKQFLEGQVRKAGGPQVSFGGEAFGQPQQPTTTAASGAPVASSAVESGEGYSAPRSSGTTSASPSLSPNQATAATSALGVPAKDSKFDSWEVAKRLNDPNVPREQKLAMRASLQPWQEKMVQDSIEAHGRLQDDLAAAKNAGGPTNWSEGMKGFIDRGMGRLASAGKAFVDFAGRNTAGTSNADTRVVPASFQPIFDATKKSGDESVGEQAKFPVSNEVRGVPQSGVRGAVSMDALSPVNNEVRGAVQNQYRYPVSNEVRGVPVNRVMGEASGTNLYPVDNANYGAVQNQVRGAAVNDVRGPVTLGSFDPEKDPAVIARRQLNGY